MAAAQGPQGGGGTTSNTSNQSQGIELQGIVADGVLGGLPVAEQNQEYFIVFKGVGGTGPEIIEQTAYFIEYLVDSDGNIFKPTENTSALNNLLQNFPIQKPVSVILDNPSNASSNLGGKIELTAVGLQTPILYSQTGSSAGAFTGSLFFKNDPLLGYSPTDSTLAVPNMQAYMIRTASSAAGGGFDFGSFNDFLGGTPAFTSGNARSASLANGKYFTTSSNFSDLQTFEVTLEVSVRLNENATSNDLTLMIFAKKANGNPLLNVPNGGVIGGNSVVLPGFKPNATFLTITTTATLGQGPFPFAPFSNGDFLQAYIQGGGDNELSNLEFESIKFGVASQGSQNPPTSESDGLLQLAGGNAPPFWLTGSNSLYITASEYLSSKYRDVQETSSEIEVIGSTWSNYNLSPIKVPFITKVGDRIRFLYNPALDFHIYDVKDPQDEVDGRLKLKINTILSQSITETNMSNFVLHRTDVSLPKYVILNVDKSSGVVNTTENPFSGVILPQFPSEKLLNNLDSILNKLKVEGILEN
jgi:hypothetical protein